MKRFSTLTPLKRANKWDLPNLEKPKEEPKKPLRLPTDWRNQKLEPWQRQKFALKEKFQGEQWKPHYRLSRETMNGIRWLKKEYPNLQSDFFAERFKVSPEDIRRILKSKWKPTVEEEMAQAEKWKSRRDKFVELSLGRKIVENYMAKHDTKKKNEDESVGRVVLKKR